VLTVVGCLIFWQAISLLFLEVFLPGPLVLLDRMIMVYGDSDIFAADAEHRYRRLGN